MKEIVLRKNFILPTSVIFTFYLISTTFLMNKDLVKDTLIGAYSLQYKTSLLLSLLTGMWTAMNGLSLAILLFTALLTGANLTLLWQRIRLMKSLEKLHLVVGGNSLLGIVGSGCAACGLPVLSLLGLSGSVVYLPLRGAELSYLAVVLLSVSFFLLTRSNMKQNCLLPEKRRTK